MIVHWDLHCPGADIVGWAEHREAHRFADIAPALEAKLVGLAPLGPPYETPHFFSTTAVLRGFASFSGTAGSPRISDGRS